MKQYWIMIITFLILGVFASPQEDVPVQNDLTSTEVDYNNPSSIASTPPDRIDIGQAIENGNGGSLTAQQWAYGDNLNKLADLSTYPNAQAAVQQKFPGSSLDLSGGNTLYNDGVLTNGDAPPLDLKNKDLHGSLITALEGGGFGIEGSESTFNVDDNEFDLRSDSETFVEIGSDNRILLSSDARMTGSRGTEIEALAETRINAEEAQISVVGGGTVKDPLGTIHLVGESSDGKESGIHIDYVIIIP